jgi:non-canonical purine NTP pyrophosphatase (RdgB/HAM1 family)
MTIYFVTGNKNKFGEMQKVITNLVEKDVDLPEIQETDPHVIIKEKLTKASELGILPCIVEDTSLYFECLKGSLPGPLIKWFLQTLGNEGLYSLARTLGNTKATAKTIIGYMSENHEVFFFEGDMQGTVVEPAGSNGFGWNPIFMPEGETKTFAEMSDEERGKYSMRKKAAIKLKEFLSDIHKL